MAPDLLSRLQAKQIVIKGITSNSRNVKKNFIFFAIKGSNNDGNKYIKDILKKKPSAIITSKKNTYSTNIPIIIVKDVRREYASTAYRFYKHKIDNKIAVTGTNGKTSVAFFVQFILKQLNNKCGIIGTLGNDYKGIKTNLTTPDSLHIAQLLQKFYKNNYNSVAMEASSHALDQGRIYGLNFDILALTNITHDHLDYHKNLSNYINAKLKLFTQNAKSNCINIISNDTQNYTNIKKKLKLRNIKYLTFGYKQADFQIKEISHSKSRVEMQLKHESKKYIFKFNNLPKFQITNFLLAASIVSKIGYKLNNIKSLSLNIPSVPGRMELAGIKKNKAKIFIDFAHTPDALKNVLKEASQMGKGKLHVVFGCGGERDKHKRPLMGKIASKYADSVVITDDNPRNENPEIIRRQIINRSLKMIEISDRRKAIKYAINKLLTNDILIIAGKGHEKYQIIKSKSLPFDDVKISKRYI